MNKYTKAISCRICGEDKAAEWLYPREMMFGRRNHFTYFRCAMCECLQAAEVPIDLAEYYPKDYYSLQTLPDPSVPWWIEQKRRWAFPYMTSHKLGWNNLWGSLLCQFKNGPPYPGWLQFLAHATSHAGGVLDVGCGSGMNLLSLRDCGFIRLRGVDPFIPKSISYKGDVRIDKCQLQEVKGKFGLIMFHHVFEHLENPLLALEQARQLLAPDGQILIRIPMSDSMPAKKYQENWVQLDAPRHITLNTRKSMDLAAKKTGMKIARVVYDSTEFQFWGSEQYLLDIPLMDKRSFQNNPPVKIFDDNIISSFIEQSKILNQKQQGDQAAFTLVC